MRHLGVISLIFVATLVLQCQPATGDDLADLKAANEKFDEAFTAGDVDTIFEIWQDGAVVLMGNGFPSVTNNAMLLPVIKEYLENNTNRYNWYKVDYRVIGDTGLVWGVGTGNVTNKATNETVTTYGKSCRVFVKSDGQWKIVMQHSSPIVLE